jgi:hypothetical protein
LRYFGDGQLVIVLIERASRQPAQFDKLVQLGAPRHIAVVDAIVDRRPLMPDR